MEIAEPKNLREFAKERLLKDVLKQITHSVNNKIQFFTLVIDKPSTKVVSSLLKMHELIPMKITLLEKLELSRKPFPENDAIYILDPSSASIDLLAKDFADLKNPKYQNIHLCFLNRVDNDSFNFISKSPLLMKRIKSFKEININFSVFDTNIFSFNFEYSYNFFTKSPSNVLVDEIATKLFTLCNTLNEFPYIQFYNQSKFCVEVSSKLGKLFAEFLKRNPAFNKKDPRATLIIIDRAIDIWSPVIHDLNYYSVILECNKVEDDFTIKGIPDKGMNQIINLTEEDEIFNKYKYEHIATTQVKIGTEFQEFAESLKNANAQNISAEKLQDSMHKQWDNKLKKQSFQIHINLASYSGKQFLERNFVNLVELEQKIISGKDASFSGIKHKEIFNEIKKINTDFPNLTPEEKLRLYLIYLSCYEVKQKNQDILSQSLNPNEKELLSKLVWLGYNKRTETKKSRRIAPEMCREEREILEKKKSLYPEGIVHLRSLPIIAQILNASVNGEVSKFNIAGEMSNEAIKKQESKSNDAVIKPLLNYNFLSKGKDNVGKKIILFIIGGISIQEISIIHNLIKKDIIKANIVLGGTNILTSSKFITSIKNIGEEKISSNDIKIEISENKNN